MANAYFAGIVLAVAAANLIASTTSAADSACTPVQYAKIKPPRYPPSAIAARATGTTMLLLTVAPDGTPQDITVANSSGNADLDTAAQEQVALWRFEPSRCEGRTVARKVQIPVNFNLTDDAIPDVPWEVAPDLEIMEKATISEELSYLRGRTDVETRSSDAGAYHAEQFYDFDKQVVWIVAQSTRADATQIGRLRIEVGPHVYKGYYSTLCNGAAEWCSTLAAKQLEAFKHSAPPPPPPKPPGARPRGQ